MITHISAEISMSLAEGWYNL